MQDFQAKYLAYQLSLRRSLDDDERLAAALLDAKVDPKPHQISSALFSFRSPFSKGVILADEVGLGKTIEAGIIISQKWAERKRKILVIVPSSLRQQWAQELEEKFFLKSEILDTKKLEKLLNYQKPPFDLNKILIVSYDFARRYSESIKLTPWDLVVIDEAHRLRNVYKPNNVTANVIKETFAHVPKVLLTATPLQNSLLELYGLVSIIDDQFFGNIDGFKEQYINAPRRKLDQLRKRLSTISYRTLRRDVNEYINYTSRHSITQRFRPTAEEQELYTEVTQYLQREILYALPKSQRSLITLLLLKLLGSSSFAIAHTLEGIANRLEAEINSGQKRSSSGKLIIDEELVNDLEEEFEDEDVDDEVIEHSPKDLEAMREEVSLLKKLAVKARSIKVNKKAEALQDALVKGFQALDDQNAPRKAIIFTESTRTQQYLKDVLENTELKGKIVCFNGSNSDESSTKMYNEWKEKHKGTDRITNVLSADKRAAIVEFFKDTAEIMIATEAASEGINLQFCALVINYDLPWNPQRVEQRIGRCHRYGQKHDVVVVNLLNEANFAEERILELLKEKFSLFDGVFGASDEVLGAIESGIDFENTIVNIIRTCRTEEEIEASFNKLQQELGDKITHQMKKTRQQLFENFDVEVQEKLRVTQEKANCYLNNHERWLWQITKHALNDYASFNDSNLTFNLTKKSPYNDSKLGTYAFKNAELGYVYRFSHDLAQSILEHTCNLKTPASEIIFQLPSDNHVGSLSDLVDKQGVLSISCMRVENNAASEDHLLLVGQTDDGVQMDDEQIHRLLQLPVLQAKETFIDAYPKLTQLQQKEKQRIEKTIEKRNKKYLEEEFDKLDAWAEDLRRAKRQKIYDLEKQIKELKKQARLVGDLNERLEIETKRRKLERKLLDAEDTFDRERREIENKKDELLDEIMSKLKSTIQVDHLFSLIWSLQ